MVVAAKFLNDYEAIRATQIHCDRVYMLVAILPSLFVRVIRFYADAICNTRDACTRLARIHLQIVQTHYET